jgi:hypothetical protein
LEQHWRVVRDQGQVAPAQLSASRKKLRQRGFFVALQMKRRGNASLWE